MGYILTAKLFYTYNVGSFRYDLNWSLNIQYAHIEIDYTYMRNYSSSSLLDPSKPCQKQLSQDLNIISNDFKIRIQLETVINQQIDWAHFFLYLFLT